MENIEYVGTLGQALTSVYNEHKTLKNKYDSLNQLTCLMAFQMQFNLSSEEMKRYAKFVIHAFDSKWITYSCSGFEYNVVFIGDESNTLQTPENFVKLYHHVKSKNE